MQTNELSRAPELPLELWQLIVDHVLDGDRRYRNPLDPWRWDLLRIGGLCRSAYAATRPIVFRELILPIRRDLGRAFPRECGGLSADAVPFPNLRPVVDLSHPLVRHVTAVSSVPELYPLVVLDGKLYFTSLARDGDTTERVQLAVTSLWSSVATPDELKKLECLIHGGLVLVPFPISSVSSIAVLDPYSCDAELSPIFGGRRWSRLPFLFLLNPHAIRTLVVSSDAKDAPSLVSSLSRRFPHASSCRIEQVAHGSFDGAKFPAGVRDIEYDAYAFDYHLAPAINALRLTEYQLARLREAGLADVIGDPYIPTSPWYSRDEERGSDSSADEYAGSDSDNDNDSPRRLLRGLPRFRAYRRVRTLTLRGDGCGYFEYLEDIMAHPHIERMTLLAHVDAMVTSTSPFTVSMPSLRYLELSHSLLSAIQWTDSSPDEADRVWQCTPNSFPVLDTLVLVSNSPEQRFDKRVNDRGNADYDEERGEWTTVLPELRVTTSFTARNLRKLVVWSPSSTGAPTRMYLRRAELKSIPRNFPNLEQLILPHVVARMAPRPRGSLLLPRLQELDVSASVCGGLEETDLPALRKLTVRGSVQRIPVARWPNLREVAVRGGGEVPDEVRTRVTCLPGFKKLEVS
ncbi:hypothetical protein H9P43_002631 [Blastocladiella emersonii ATCC 22665]|nr:hypothetical protein H9P43_002631 [Blastocladiella emersonii ATCC 22665]